MDYKISSIYDDHICTLESGEKVYSARITFHSSNLDDLNYIKADYYHKMDSFESIKSIGGLTGIDNILGFVESADIKPIKSELTDLYPECDYKFSITIVYVKEPSSYTFRDMALAYYNYLINKRKEEFQ